MDIQTNAVQSRRRAVNPGSPPVPTSGELIDKAEAAGTISSETALLYRVYALFNDARLPQQYRGDDTGLQDSLYLGEVRSLFSTLSPQTQALVAPYVTPPAYKGSWANSADTPVRALNDPPPCDFFSDKWAFVDAVNSPVRVWYRLELPDALNASRIASVIDTKIWPMLVGVMGRSPISDDAESCSGGNGRLDLYLTDIAREGTISYSGFCLPGLPTAEPAFILLSRASSDSTVAHEIFHAIQFAFPVSGSACRDKYKWWMEASANWAMDFVFPKAQGEQIGGSELLSFPEKELDFRNDRHEYSAYLLPFYVDRKTGDRNFMRVAWENCATQPALEAIDKAIPGGFDAVWPEFVRYNWNREPFNDYFKWDELKFVALTPEHASIDVTMAGKQDAALPIKVELPRLSATYKHYKFLDDNTRTVMFWNGATWDLQLQDRPLGGRQYEARAATGEAKKGARVQALIKLAGQDWKAEDWTNIPYRSYCRDMAAERLDELVLIFSNSEFKDRDRKLKPPGVAPLLWTSNMGCWQWNGNVTYKHPSGFLSMSTDVTWTRPEQSQTAPSVTYSAAGTLNWVVSGECTGSGSLPIAGFNTMSTYNFITAEGTFRRSYIGAGEETRLVGVVCQNGSGQSGLTAWMLSPLQPFIAGIPGARLMLVNDSGNVMDDSHQILAGQVGTWKWHFEAQRQP